MSGEKIFISDPFAKSAPVPTSNKPVLISAPVVVAVPGASDQQIIAVLDEYVRPAVEQDGGAIEFRSFMDGVVTVALKGSCSGCPSSTLTLKSGIENLLKQMVPGVESVVAEEG